MRTAGIDGITAAVVYEYPLPWLVGAAKFRRELAAAGALGEVLSAAISPSHGGARVPVLIPVPLHPRRLAARGFNQAEEIARVTARRRGYPLLPAACRRVRNTPPQTGSDAGARRRNLRGAFRAAPGLAGLDVAIVDDVLTTGATVSSMALALKAAGVARVEVWCAARVVARAPPLSP